MIRFARPGDRAQLKLLWQEAFGDSDKDTAFYFDHRHRDDRLLLWEQDDVIAGMLTLLPCDLMIDGTAYPARYIYAVATAQAFRRQGISTQLMQHAHAWMQQQGLAASVLAPATPELFDFYAKRGYTTTFYVSHTEVSFPADGTLAANTQVRPASLATYTQIRDAAMVDSRLYVRWDAEALGFVLLSEKAAGNQVFHITAPGGEACAICQHIAPEQVRVVELITLGLRSQEALCALHSQLQAQTYVLRLPQNAWPDCPPTPLGMIYPLTDLPKGAGGPAYLGLIKD